MPRPIYATEQWTVETNRTTQSNENAFITVYTTRFSFCHKFNFVINELLITRVQLFLHDRTLSDFRYDRLKVSSHQKGIRIFWNILCMKSKSINSSLICCSLNRDYRVNYEWMHLWNVLRVCLCEICWARFTNYAVSITHTSALSINASGNAFMNILSSVIRNAMGISGTHGLLMLVRGATWSRHISDEWIAEYDKTD